MRLALSKLEMKNIFLSAVVILTVSDATRCDDPFRGLTLRVERPRESYQRRIPFGEADAIIDGLERAREDRGLLAVRQPMCNEIRAELSAAVYVPNVANAEIYTFRPQKIYMVNCSREIDDGDELGAGCGPQHCREKYVDIDIFGKPKTVKENLWQLMMEIPSVPVACECFRVP